MSRAVKQPVGESRHSEERRLGGARTAAVSRSAAARCALCGRRAETACVLLVSVLLSAAPLRLMLTVGCICVMLSGPAEQQLTPHLVRTRAAAAPPF